MIAFEVMFLMVLGAVIIVTVAAIGRPMAEAYAEKLKVKYKEIGSDRERELKTRLETLEQDVLELHRQMSQIQESQDFIAGYLETSKGKPLEAEQTG